MKGSIIYLTYWKAKTQDWQWRKHVFFIDSINWTQRTSTPMSTKFQTSWSSYAQLKVTYSEHSLQLNTNKNQSNPLTQCPSFSHLSLTSSNLSTSITQGTMPSPSRMMTTSSLWEILRLGWDLAKSQFTAISVSTTGIMIQGELPTLMTYSMQMMRDKYRLPLLKYLKFNLRKDEHADRWCQFIDLSRYNIYFCNLFYSDLKFIELKSR
jgi:hypothetical protein